MRNRIAEMIVRFRDSLRERVTLVLVVPICSWILMVSSMSIFGDGLFYTIEQPVPASKVAPRVISLQFKRYVLIPFDGECSNYLVCEDAILHLHEGVQWRFEKGYAEYNTNFPMLGNISGLCYLRGTVKYQPLGWIGPTMHYTWESEEFRLD